MAVIFFIWAIDGMIAVNRWWTEDMGGIPRQINSDDLRVLYFLFARFEVASRLPGFRDPLHLNLLYRKLRNRRAFEVLSNPL